MRGRFADEGVRCVRRPVSVNFFVGVTLMVCAVLAVVPTLLKEDEHGSTTPPTDDLAASLSG